jgi:hypothetical protein
MLDSPNWAEANTWLSHFMSACSIAMGQDIGDDSSSRDLAVPADRRQQEVRMAACLLAVLEARDHEMLKDEVFGEKPAA